VDRHGVLAEKGFGDGRRFIPQTPRFEGLITVLRPVGNPHLCGKSTVGRLIVGPGGRGFRVPSLTLLQLLLPRCAHGHVESHRGFDLTGRPTAVTALR
jgi:hypothetical protein